MAGYTFNSGKRTESITSRCPICLEVKKYDVMIEHKVNNSYCCSEECKEQWLWRLKELKYQFELWRMGHHNSYRKSFNEAFEEYITSHYEYDKVRI